MSAPKLKAKIIKRYESNLSRSITLLDDLITEATPLLAELHAGKHYCVTSVDNIHNLADRLRSSYMHVVECDNFIKELNWIEAESTSSIEP